MILHLCEDEKFIDHVINIFELVAPNKNIYFIEPNFENKSLQLVKSKHPNIIAKPVDSKEFKDLIDRIEDYDAVILHNLYNPYKKEIVKNAPENVYFHWMCWGADLYNIPALSRKLLLKETKKRHLKQFNWKGKINQYLYNYFFSPYLLIYKIRNRKTHSSIENKKLFKKISSVSTVIPPDFKLIEKNINPSLKYLPFKYGTIESFMKNHNEAICQQNNFLIGNSANITNNYLDIFKILKNVNLNGKKIFAPLSYGDKTNAEFISKEGQKQLGSKFHALMEFLPIEDYNQILNKCGNVIMNHKRQQGMGNIIMALWKGARVFLNKRNPVYAFLKSEGFIIFEIKDVKKYQELPDFNVLAKHNRPLLEKIYSTEKVLEETRKLVKYLQNKNC